MPDVKLSTAHLILWPSIVTLVVSIVRLFCEVEGVIAPTSGGALSPLGIAWLMLLFGGYFGFRLTRAGSAPNVARPALWSLLLILAVIGVGYWMLKDIDPKDTSAAGFALFAEKLMALMMAIGCAALGTLVLWTRLGWTLLCYGVVARTGVMAITWLAKYMNWDTHYTKLGPAGLTRDMTETLQATGIAQFGLWVPATIVLGGFFGCLFAKGKRS